MAVRGRAGWAVLRGTGLAVLCGAGLAVLCGAGLFVLCGAGLAALMTGAGSLRAGTEGDNTGGSVGGAATPVACLAAGGIFGKREAETPKRSTMRVVVQRVSTAAVVVDGQEVGRIGAGLLSLLGIRTGDTLAEARYLARKCVEMRIFTDPDGRLNLSVGDVGGAILVVSQFTLYADCRRGRRPWSAPRPR